MSNIPSVEALRGVHQFPDWYTMKIFGPAGHEFIAACNVAIHQFMDADPERYRVSTRESKEGNHVCVTVLAYYQDAEDVRRFYKQLLENDDVRMIL